MRLLFASDLHARRGPTLAETAAGFTWIAEDAARRHALAPFDAIVLGGDLHDTSSTPEDRAAVADLVQALARIAPVVILYGNPTHDYPGHLDLLPRLATVHPVTVYDAPAVHRLTGGAIAVLPWLDRVVPVRELRGYSAAAARAEEEARLAAILDDLGAQLDDATRDGGERVFAGHLMLAGAVPGMGQPDLVGRDFVVSLDDLARVGASAYLLGHVHAGQAWSIGRVPVVYNGSTRRTAFGETETKRTTLLTVEAGVAAVEHITVPCRPMLLLADVWGVRKY